MPSVQEAINVLKDALLEKGVDSHVQDAFNHLASCLVLLDSSAPSVQMIRKLCTVLRQPLLPLYNACLQPALQLSSSVLSTVLKKLCDAHNIEDESLRAAWDATAEVIFSGILDFLDQKDGGIGSGGATWEVLYRIICEFFFLDSGRGLPVFSVPLCLSAYNTLTETATKQITIRNALRHSAVLGGERLGFVISRTRDYLLLEALLMLFARLLPPIHNTPQGKSRRAKFVKEVWGSMKLFKCHEELFDVMQKTSGTQWDDVAAQIIDTLARSDTTYPQPFSIDEIDVCGRIFPQPLATDRLILDKEAFLANIIVENDDPCESLQLPYTHIRTITLDNSERNVPKGKVLIMVYLTSPPLVANVEMKFRGTNHLYAKFLLENDTVGRFMEALRRRGVGKLNFLNPLTRVQRKPKSISIGLGFKFADDSSPIPPTASFEGKVQLVNQVYKTDVEELATSEAVEVPHVGGAGSSPALNPRPTFKDETIVPEAPESVATEEVPAIAKNSRLAPANEMPKPPRCFSLPFSPRNSIGAAQLFGDSDELSEISEFEHDNDAVVEQAVTGVPVPCIHELKPKQHKMDRIRLNGGSSVTSAMGINKSSKPVSKTGDRTEGVAQKSHEAGELPFTSDSPMFGSSSSTQINVSPGSLSKVDILLTTDGTGVSGGLSFVSQDSGDIDKLKQLDFDACERISTERNICSEKKPPTRFISTEDRRFPQPSGSVQKGHSRIKISKDACVPPKIAGSRRKREPIKPSSMAIIEIDDESTPPRKKSRNDRLAIKEDRPESNDASLAAAVCLRARRHRKTTNEPSSGTNPMTVDFDEFPKFRSTCQGTRRSSRIKERQTAATSGTRSDVIRSKIRKGKLAGGQSACGTGCKKLATVPLQDISVTIGCGTASTSSPCPIPPTTREVVFPKISSHVPSVEARSAENISLETSLPRETLKTSNISPCEPCHPAKGLRRDPDPAQQPISSATRPAKEPPRVKIEETIDEREIVAGPRAVANDAGRVQGPVEYPTSLKETNFPMELTRANVVPTSGQEAVTIDLTIENSPARGKNELHTASVDLMRSGTDIQTKIGNPDQPNSVVLKEPPFVLSPRHRRRSVTFASPIEYVLDTKVKSRKRVRSSIASQSRRSRSPFEGNILSPLRIPAGTVNTRCESSDRIVPRATLQESKSLQAHIKASVHNQIADDAGIQDIVEVLNEIQAVIIKGVSGKFKSVEKNIQHGRDELIQRVLNELQGMVVENAKYFNDLVRLEEDYYEHGKAITRCWEELIDYNDGIAAQLQDVLKEHDQNTSARTFPKSLLPLQPVFVRRRANA